MSTVGQKERQTQARVIKFFRERLDYDFLGNWIDREDNRNIEENSLRNWLAERGVSEALITRTLHQLGKAASLGEGLIVEQGEGALDKLPKGIRDNKEAMAETIENNLRKLIIDEQPVNPKYYEKMSELLDALIQERKAQALEYREYLKKLVELAGKVKKPAETSEYPTSLDTPAKWALYDNLDHNGALAIQIDTTVRYTKKSDWRGNRFKEREVFNAIREELGTYEVKAEEIFELVKNQREY